MKVSLPAPDRSRPSSRGRLGRLVILTGTLCAAFAAWVLWLGWPSPERVTGRLTPLATAQPGEWVEASPGLLTRSVHIVGVSGLEVKARVLRPADGEDVPLPVLVVLGGHRTGQDAVEAVGGPDGVIVIALNYPYNGPEKLRGVRQILSTLPQIRHALLDTPAAVSLALDWLLEQPSADPDRVELVGVSLGTQFSAAAGAADPRFRRVWFVQGAGDSRRWIVHQLEGRIGNRFLRRATATLLWWLAHGATLDPQLWVGQIAPRSVVVIGARQDPALPHGLVAGLHDAAGPPRQLHWIDGGHVSPRRPETVRPLLDLIIPELE